MILEVNRLFRVVCRLPLIDKSIVVMFRSKVEGIQEYTTNVICCICLYFVFPSHQLLNSDALVLVKAF